MLVAGAVEIDGGKSRRMAAHVAPPWIHRLFSNLKRWRLGVYHGLRKINLQHYLEEFEFRFNQRRTRHAAFDPNSGSWSRIAWLWEDISSTFACRIRPPVSVVADRVGGV